MVEPQIASDGTAWRDLNHNGRMDPFEDPRLSVAERVADLLPRLSLPELAGLLFHTVIEAGPGGTLLPGPGHIAKSGTREVVVGKHLNHFNVHALTDARSTALWANRLQELACELPHAIPVTISTDPRHAAAQNVGTSWAAAFFSEWPDPLGLAALDDPTVVEQHFDVVRREYAAVGIRMALHPTADLATEPRWGRLRETFGQDSAKVTAFLRAALRGLQGEALGPGSVAATVKHFPGAGPQAGGEDAHFPYGRDQVYPGGNFAAHLAPFQAPVDLGAAAIMPYYGRPVGLVLDGEPVEEVGFGYNRQLLTGLLRGSMGYDGIILADWELITDNHVAGQVLPARAWGVEELDPAGRMLRLLDAGVDQFGGEECVELLLSLAADGRVPRRRLEQSAARILALKFRLGLFDDPFVDVDAAAGAVGTPQAVQWGLDAQSRSVVVLADDGLLPLRRGASVLVDGLDPACAGDFFEVVDHAAEADAVLVRLPAPFEPRDDLFLEAEFHQGSLEFPPGLPHRLRHLAAGKPLVIDVMADRPAICTPLLGIASTLTATFGVSDRAWLRALTGDIPAQGRLPVDLPSSMAEVRDSREDLPGDTPNPLFRAGHGPPRS